MDIEKTSYSLPDSIYTTPKIRKYSSFGSLHSYRKGDVIFQPGDVLERLVYIVSGSVRVSMISDGGQEQMLYTSRADGILGLLFAREDEPTCVVALEETVLCMYSADQLKALCVHDPDVILELMHNNINKTGYFMSQLASRKWFSAETRIFKLLYNTALEKGVLKEGLYEITLKLTQKTISEITGVHFVTVSRCLKNLKELGVAEKVKSGFIIYDMEKLRELIEESVNEPF